MENTEKKIKILIKAINIFLRTINLKKIILNSLIFLFIVYLKLYCFDDILEDIFDDFEDLFKIVGIIAMIIAVMYFVKKFIIWKRNDAPK